MRLSDSIYGVTGDRKEAAAWKEKGYELPAFDIQAVREKTKEEPAWIHFGAGNIFRAFPAAVLHRSLEPPPCRWSALRSRRKGIVYPRLTWKRGCSPA